MAIRLKLVMAELILVAVVGGLMAPVYADYTPAYDGHVYGCDDGPLEGAVVLIEIIGTNCSHIVYTNDTGYYLTDANASYPVKDQLIRITASYDGLSATREVVVSETAQRTLTVDFRLCKEMPVFTSVGILALISLLSAIAAVAIVRKKG
jgi:hypothetical protein